MPRHYQSLALFCTAVIPAATAAAVDERAILRELYDATGGKAWKENYGWTENLDDLCAWTGVICDPDELKDDHHDLDRRRRLQSDSRYKVIGLDLDDNDLSGRTPESLWSLPALQFVDVSFNPKLSVSLALPNSNTVIETIKLHDTSTFSLAGVQAAKSSLRYLHVSGSPLNSEFPAELLQLTALEQLHISNSALQGTLPSEIAELSHLRKLNVAENTLTGTLPSTLGQLTHLRDLALSKNRFSGRVPDLDDLTSLTVLYANHNALSGPLPSFATQRHMMRIDLQDNAFEGTIPEDFLLKLNPVESSSIVVSVNVDLSGNQLTAMPATLDRLADRPMDWKLADNLLTSIPTEFCDNNNWNHIKHHGCDGLVCSVGTFSPTGYASTAAGDCRSCPSIQTVGSTLCLDQDDYSILKSLYVATGGDLLWRKKGGWLKDKNYCSWHGVRCADDEEVGRNADMTGRVRSLDLINNGLVGTVPPTIFHLKYLRHLSLSRNEIVVPFDLIGENSHIHEIFISNTLTKDFRGLDKVNNKSLRYLFADRLPIQGTLPTEILGVHTLKILSLSECEIKGSLSSSIGQIGALEELFLFDNQLRGVIPTHVGQLQNLRVLSMAKNMFASAIPTELEKLPDLFALSLADQVTKGGGITGQVLPFSNSRHLKSLMLGGNLLEGSVPEDLMASADLDAALAVDLSKNRLSGRVPGTLAKFEYMNLYLEDNEITELDHRLCAMENWMGGLVADHGCDAILCPINSKGGRMVYDDVGCQECDGLEEKEWMGQEQCQKETDLSEKGVLELIYNKCGGVDWHRKDNWMSQEHICNWSGVTCNDQRSVQAISLGRNQVIGDFPTEVYTVRLSGHRLLPSSVIGLH